MAAAAAASTRSSSSLVAAAHSSCSSRQCVAAAVQRPAAAVSSRRHVLARAAETLGGETLVAEPLMPQQARKEYKPLTPEDLVNHPVDPEQFKLPKGYHWYETMIVLRAMMDDQGRDEQLAKFEAYLNKEGCLHINVIVRNRSRMAYPMKKNNWDGMYVLFTYAAKRQTARSVQLVLSNPEAGSEDKILRHITFCRM